MMFSTFGLPRLFALGPELCLLRGLRALAAGQLRKLTVIEGNKLKELIVPGPEKHSSWWLPRPINENKKVYSLRPMQPSAKLRIALVREGCTNRPFYTIQVKYNKAHSKDQGIEQVGSWDPFPNEGYGEQLVGLNINRIFYWIAQGAEPTMRVAELLGIAGIMPVHPHSYLIAHRTRTALMTRLKEKKSDAKLEVEHYQEPIGASVTNDEESVEDVFSRPDGLWRKKNSRNDWWRHGLV